MFKLNNYKLKSPFAIARSILRSGVTTSYSNCFNLSTFNPFKRIFSTSIIGTYTQNKPFYSLIKLQSIDKVTNFMHSFNIYLKLFGSTHKPVTTRSQLINSAVEVCFSYIMMFEVLDTRFLHSVSSRNMRLTLPENLFFLANTFCRLVLSNPKNKTSPTTYGAIWSEQNLSNLLLALFPVAELSDESTELVSDPWVYILEGTLFSHLLRTKSDLNAFKIGLESKIRDIMLLDKTSLQFLNYTNGFYNSLGSHCMLPLPVVHSLIGPFNEFIHLHKFTGSKIDKNIFYIHFSSLASFKSELTETGLLVILKVFEPEFYLGNDSTFSEVSVSGDGHINQGQFLIDMNNISLTEIYHAYFTIKTSSVDLPVVRQEPPKIGNGLGTTAVVVENSKNNSNRRFSTFTHSGLIRESSDEIYYGLKFTIQYSLRLDVCIVSSFEIILSIILS